MKMKDIREEERPREKMMARGASALDDAELLAILIRTGTGKVNVLETARTMLSAAGFRLSRLSGWSLEEMMEIPGIGPDKAVTVTAAMELGKRFMRETGPGRMESITDASQVYRLMLPYLKGLTHEECWVLFLDRAHHVVSQERLTSGGMSSTILDIRIIMRKALEKKAHGLILVHNHPSGNPQPGSHDIRQTALLKKAAATFDISLIDHVVVSDDRYYSFTDEEVTRLSGL